VINCNARAFRDGHALLDRCDEMAQKHALFVAQTRRPSELDEALSRACEHGVDRIIFCGGDSTFSLGVTASERIWQDCQYPLPAFGFAAAGTVATIPHSLGVAGRGSTLQRLHSMLQACQFVEVPTLRVTLQKQGRESSQLAFIVGSGLVAHFFSLYDPEGARRNEQWRPSDGKGLSYSAYVVARVFVESLWNGPFAQKVLAPIACDVSIDGQDLPWRASSLIAVSVLRDLGLGMRVTYRAGEDPCRPHVVVSSLPPSQLGPQLPAVLQGRTICGNPQVHFDNLATALDLRFHDAHTMDCNVVIDGDPRHADRVCIVAGPRIAALYAQRSPLRA
jgi:diacylglycerol kinase family enzyme